MPTMEMESRSTDKRIDDLNARMSEGFQRVDEDIRELRGDVKSIDARFDAMHRTMMRGFFAIGTINVTVFLAFTGLHGL